MSSPIGSEIERLIQLLARLPGLGPRSARRAALHLIRKREALLAPLADAIRVAADRVTVCTTCNNIDTQSPCGICRDERRDPSLLVVVADVGDLWALERSGALKACYHVLGGTLSAARRHRSRRSSASRASWRGSPAAASRRSCSP